MVVVFPLSLYKDAAAIRRATIAWNPNPYFYGALGFSQLVAFMDARLELFTLPLVVALIYLYQRYRYVDTW